MRVKSFSRDERNGCFQHPTCLFFCSSPLPPHPDSLRFALSYSAHHRGAWRQSDVFSADSLTCTCQRSWMSHLNWQQMVLFGYVNPDLSAQPTLHAIYHHSPSLSSPPRPLKGLRTTILCAIIYLCAGECQCAQPWAFHPGSEWLLVYAEFRQGSMGHFLMMWFSDKPGKIDWLKSVPVL